MQPEDRRTAPAAAHLARTGMRDAPIEIVEYDPAWQASYAAERARLAPLLPGAEILHIGSTAVPGLAAKPIIDIAALVEDLGAPIPALVRQAGYQFPRAFNTSPAHHRFLCYPTTAHRTHHLHLLDEREELDRRLRFRDRLRENPTLAGEYAALKWALAERFRENREGYTEAKTTFIQRAESIIPPQKPHSDES